MEFSCRIACKFYELVDRLNKLVLQCFSSVTTVSMCRSQHRYKIKQTIKKAQSSIASTNKYIFHTILFFNHISYQKQLKTFHMHMAHKTRR